LSDGDGKLDRSARGRVRADRAGHQAIGPTVDLRASAR